MSFKFGPFTFGKPAALPKPAVSPELVVIKAKDSRVIASIKCEQMRKSRRISIMKDIKAIAEGGGFTLYANGTFGTYNAPEDISWLQSLCYTVTEKTDNASDQMFVGPHQITIVSWK
jgi:hypothetical protein